MKKGFTLIELLAVIVVLAILALVVTPIVLNIVENAQTGSDERSLEQYAKVMQTSYYELKMKDTSLTLEDYLKQVDINDVSGVSLTYNGSRVFCDEKVAVQTDNGAQTIELYGCIVDGRGTYQFVDGKAEKIEGERIFDAKALKYTPMEIVYFNVKDGVAGCTNYHEENSKTGYNGINPTGNQTNCLKFYKYAENKGKSVMILDHNTTATIAWTNSSTTSNANGPIDVIAQLKIDTADWKGTIEPADYSMDQTGQTSGAKYTIDYSGYKARLITAQEIAMITGNTSWDETTATSFYCFDSLTTSASETCKSGNISGCKYGWLYDRTSTNCTTYGCLNNSNIATYGYWTVSSNAHSSHFAWYVHYFGNVRSTSVDYSSSNGVRPVITISKS